jgi:hypothetical protein
MQKSAAVGSVFIQVDLASHSTQGLWFRASSDASTALTADLHVKLTKNQQGSLNDTDWTQGSLSQGSFEVQTDFGLINSRFNISVGDQIWLTFFPSCSGCSSTVEFSVETAWYVTGQSTSTYPDILLINNTRTMVFEKPQGSYIPFYTVVTSTSAFFYTSVVYDDTLTTKNSEIVLYWSKDFPYNGSTSGAGSMYQDIYPAGDGVIKGNYLTTRPFNANSSGTWFITPFVKVGATGNSDPEFTIKVGFNAVPCSSASMLSVSFFLALLPFLTSLW